MTQLKYIAVLFTTGFLTGCFNNAKIVQANIEQAYKLAKDESGVIYGVAGLHTDESISASKVCQFIEGRDPRCSHAEEYIPVSIWSGFGMFAASAVTVAIIPKDSSIAKDIAYFKGRVGDRKQPYVKARAIKGQLATVLEVASTHGDGKCYWQGLPRVGGTVCPHYGWDYRKDMKSWDSTWGVLSVD